MASLAVVLLALAGFSYFLWDDPGRVSISESQGVDAPYFSAGHVGYVTTSYTGESDTDGMTRIQYAAPSGFVSGSIDRGKARHVDGADASVARQLSLPSVHDGSVDLGGGRVATGPYILDLVERSIQDAPWAQSSYGVLTYPRVVQAVGDVVHVQDGDRLVPYVLGGQPQDAIDVSGVALAVEPLVVWDGPVLRVDDDEHMIDVPESAIARAMGTHVLFVWMDGLDRGGTATLRLIELSSGDVAWDHRLDLPAHTSVHKVHSDGEMFVVGFNDAGLGGSGHDTEVGFVYGDVDGVQGERRFPETSPSTRLTAVAVHDGSVYYVDHLEVFRLAPGRNQFFATVLAAAGGLSLAVAATWTVYARRSGPASMAGSGRRCPECRRPVSEAFCLGCGAEVRA